jgi:hypothetical protein
MIRHLIERLVRMDSQIPPLPSSGRGPDFAGLTKRDAGTLTTLLREALKDAEA